MKCVGRVFQPMKIRHGNRLVWERACPRLRCVRRGIRHRQTAIAGKPAPTLDVCQSLTLLEHRFGTLANLRFSQIFFVRGHEPHMAERVFQRAGAVAVELILGF